MTDWHISSQTREAANQRFAARLKSIFERGREEARNPRNPVLRALNEARATERREQHEDIVRGAIALRKLAEDQRRIEAERVAVAKIRRVA